MKKVTEKLFAQLKKFEQVEAYLGTVLSPTEFAHDFRLRYSVESLKESVQRELQQAQDKLKTLETIRNQNRPFRHHIEFQQQPSPRSVSDSRGAPPTRFIRRNPAWEERPPPRRY